MSTEDRKILLEWIEHAFPALRPKSGDLSCNWGTWEGERPPVVAVYAWGVGQSTQIEGVFALECRHGVRGGVFRHSVWLGYNTNRERAEFVPECQRCLSNARNWSTRERERALLRQRVSQIRTFVGTVSRVVPRSFSVVIGSVAAVVTILGAIIYVYENWERLLAMLRTVL